MFLKSIIYFNDTDISMVDVQNIMVRITIWKKKQEKRLYKKNVKKKKMFIKNRKVEKHLYENK